jgi:hypothetical protein
MNNVHEFGVGKPLRFGSLSDVGSAFATATVETVTSGAGGRENLLSCGFELRFRVGGSLRRRPPDESKADTNRG